MEQAFGNTVMEGPREFSAHVHVALVAKRWRFLDHEVLVFLGVVGRVAIEAADAVCQMDGAIVIAVFLTVLVTGEAAGGGLLWGDVLEGENF